MTKKTYSECDVEKILQDAARRDRTPMDDAMSARILSLICEETAEHARKRSYVRAAGWAAALVVAGVFGFLYLGESEQPRVATVDPKPESVVDDWDGTSLAGEPYAVDTRLKGSPFEPESLSMNQPVTLDMPIARTVMAGGGEIVPESIEKRAAATPKPVRLSRIIDLLSAEVPDLQAIHAEFSGVDKCSLSFQTDSAHITVTRTPEEITVTVRRGDAEQVHHLRQQGDTLPEELRKAFARCCYGRSCHS